MKKCIGVCLGASSIALVKAEQKDGAFVLIEKLYLAHNGDPKKVFADNLDAFNSENLPVVVTGRKFRKIVNLPSISEPEATENAFVNFSGYTDGFSAIASLGGETFIVYTLDETGKIADVITKNQCASGTGEFFLQQIKRMNLPIGEVADIASDAKPHKVTGRCSVFCKSDCTHALNKGVPRSEVTSGLALMMADKVIELLKKVPPGKVLVVGGVTQNSLVMNYLGDKVPQMVIPDEAVVFEAFGAAVYGLKNNIEPSRNGKDLFSGTTGSFVFHKPLIDFKNKVVFKEIQFAKAVSGDECILGLDVGSTTTKAVIIRISDNAILASVYLYTHGDPVKAARNCYTELAKQVPNDIKIIGLGTTGSGRQIAGLHALTDSVINEIVAHATAAVHFDPELDTIFEIGGQDAKFTYIVNKVPADYAMNEACSAGTGSFIEESAYESLRVKVTDIEGIAFRADNPPNFSDQCAAFISSDIKTALQENIDKNNVIAGLVYSICLNYINRVIGTRQVGKKIFMQGGVCYNKAIPVAMAALTGKEIIVPPEPGLMGAYGVALEVKEKIDMGLTEPRNFILNELIDREVIYKKPFVCSGAKENCDLGCPINVVNIEGRNYPFGGACNKYYNILNHKKVDIEHYDYVQKRHELTFNKYAPDMNLKPDAPTVGLNLSFHTHTIYPLYYNFFTRLGFRVVLPDEADEEALQKEMTSYCYPAEISLQLFSNLLKKKPDYIFMPQIVEMYVEDGHFRLETNSTCVFISGEPFFLKQAFKFDNYTSKIVTPTLYFAEGFRQEADKFVKVALEMGVTDEKKAREAYLYAVAVQDSYQRDVYTMGEEFLKYLHSHPEEMAIVVVGRPYNSFTDFANKGIPRKFASRGVYVVPYDMFDYRNETVDEDQFWESGKKILKAAKIIKREPQLFATYISNFSCGPDSMLLTPFRAIMDTKPSLTLELDGHTADAGINTRIDAALDIINNYRKISSRINDTDNSDFNIATVEFGLNESWFITSEGERIPMTDERVVVLIPSMGDLAAQLFSAALRSEGIHAIAMPEGNPDILKYGRSVATGKECLPIILCVGALLDYMDNRWDGKKYIAFFIAQGAGHCRLGQYPVFIRDVVRRKKLKNVATLALMNDDGFAGLGTNVASRGMKALIASDVLDDIRSAVMANAADPEKGLEIFYSEFEKLVEAFEKYPKKVYKYLEIFAGKIKTDIPAKTKIHHSKYIALCGEIYVRRDHFSHKWLNKFFAKKGYVLKDAYITEWIYYVDYLIKKDLLEIDSNLKKRFEWWTRTLFMRRAEIKIKKALEKSNYYQFSKIEIEPLLNESKEILPIEFKGEPGLTLGTALHESLDKYCGIINLGPFGCMPTRLSEAITMPEMKIEHKMEIKKKVNPDYVLPEVFNGKMNIPFLTIETDGNPFPQVIEAKLETFLLQTERIAQLMKEAGLNGYKKK